MARALITISFMLVLVKWLQFEFRRDISIYKYWKWVAGALVVQAAASVVFAIYTTKAGNFFYHGVGGGVMSTLLFIYLQKTYQIQFSWRVELVILYAFVSALGVLNELGEYAFEMLHLGKYSFDSHDTWRDLVANTSGAILAWTIYKLILSVSRNK